MSCDFSTENSQRLQRDMVPAGMGSEAGPVVFASLGFKENHFWFAGLPEAFCSTLSR